MTSGMTSGKRSTPCRPDAWLLAGLRASTPAAAAYATQHFVRPGDSWQGLEGRLEPGDENRPTILCEGQKKGSIPFPSVE